MRLAKRPQVTHPNLVTRVSDKSRSRAVRYLLAARLYLGSIVHESRRSTWDIACLENGTSRNSSEQDDRQMEYRTTAIRSARQPGSRWLRQ